MSHKENVVKMIQEISGSQSPYQVFSDFVTMLAISIANASAFRHDDVWKDREKRYCDIAQKYKEEELNKFVEMKDELVSCFDEEMGDILGEVYMESGAGNKYTGQFFTPFHVSELTATATIPKDYKGDEVLRIHEPSAGAGGMIIALAKVLKDMGINYQKCMKVVAQDLDWLAVYMCYVQLSLYGIDAIVVQGDTLQDPYHEGFPKMRTLRTPRNMGALM